MVTKSKNVGAAKKSRLKVGKLKLNKERVKDLSGGQKRGVNIPFCIPEEPSMFDAKTPANDHFHYKMISASRYTHTYSEVKLPVW